MVARAEWLAILEVALDALKTRDFERAWTLFDELDGLHPSWLFEIKRAPLRRDGGKQDTPARQIIAWVLHANGMTLQRIGKFLGVSGQRANELRMGGALRLQIDDVYIEDDFPPENVRRSLRKRGWSVDVRPP